MSAIALKMQNCSNSTVHVVKNISVGLTITAGVVTFVVLCAITSAYMMTAFGLATSICQTNIVTAFTICKWGALAAASGVMAVIIADLIKRMIDSRKPKVVLSI